MQPDMSTGRMLRINVKLVFAIACASILFGYVLAISISTQTRMEPKTPEDLLADLLTIPEAEAAGADYFLKIPSVSGESVTTGHIGEINIDSFSWGVSSQATPGSASTSGKSVFEGIQFTKRLDSSSLHIFKASADGKALSTATFTIHRHAASGEPHIDSYIIKLTGVKVKSYSVRGSPSEFPIEQVAFTFDKIEIEYKKVKMANGILTTDSFKAGWDLKTNTSTTP